MKKLKFLFLFAFTLLLAKSAFALDCKNGNSFSSDECWTNVKVSSSETTPVIAGTVLVYDFASPTDANDAAFQVRVSSASTDNYKVAGVAQRTIATGDTGLVLVRGKGKIRATTAVASGDRLFTTSLSGRAGTYSPSDNTSVASRDKNIAFSLQTSTASATIDAYMVVV